MRKGSGRAAAAAAAAATAAAVAAVHCRCGFSLAPSAKFCSQCGTQNPHAVDVTSALLQVSNAVTDAGAATAAAASSSGASANASAVPVVLQASAASASASGRGRGRPPSERAVAASAKAAASAAGASKRKGAEMTVDTSSHKRTRTAAAAAATEADDDTAAAAPHVPQSVNVMPAWVDGSDSRHGNLYLLRHRKSAREFGDVQPAALAPGDVVDIVVLGKDDSSFFHQQISQPDEGEQEKQTDEQAGEAALPPDSASAAMEIDGVSESSSESDNVHCRDFFWTVLVSSLAKAVPVGQLLRSAVNVATVVFKQPGQAEPPKLPPRTLGAKAYSASSFNDTLSYVRFDQCDFFTMPLNVGKNLLIPLLQTTQLDVPDLKYQLFGALHLRTVADRAGFSALIDRLDVNATGKLIPEQIAFDPLDEAHPSSDDEGDDEDVAGHEYNDMMKRISDGQLELDPELDLELPSPSCPPNGDSPSVFVEVLGQVQNESAVLLLEFDLVSDAQASHSDKSKAAKCVLFHVYGNFDVTLWLLSQYRTVKGHEMLLSSGALRTDLPASVHQQTEPDPHDPPQQLADKLHQRLLACLDQLIQRPLLNSEDPLAIENRACRLARRACKETRRRVVKAHGEVPGLTADDLFPVPVECGSSDLGASYIEKVRSKLRFQYTDSEKLRVNPLFYPVVFTDGSIAMVGHMRPFALDPINRTGRLFQRLCQLGRSNFLSDPTHTAGNEERFDDQGDEEEQQSESVPQLPAPDAVALLPPESPSVFASQAREGYRLFDGVCRRLKEMNRSLSDFKRVRFVNFTPASCSLQEQSKERIKSSMLAGGMFGSNHMVAPLFQVIMGSNTVHHHCDTLAKDIDHNSNRDTLFIIIHDECHWAATSTNKLSLSSKIFERLHGDTHKNVVRIGVSATPENHFAAQGLVAQQIVQWDSADDEAPGAATRYWGERHIREAFARAAADAVAAPVEEGDEDADAALASAAAGAGGVGAVAAAATGPRSTFGLVRALSLSEDVASESVCTGKACWTPEQKAQVLQLAEACTAAEKHDDEEALAAAEQQLEDLIQSLMHRPVSCAGECAAAAAAAATPDVDDGDGGAPPSQPSFVQADLHICRIRSVLLRIAEVVDLLWNGVPHRGSKFIKLSDVDRARGSGTSVQLYDLALMLDYVASFDAMHRRDNSFFYCTTFRELFSGSLTRDICVQMCGWRPTEAKDTQRKPIVVDQGQLAVVRVSFKEIAEELMHALRSVRDHHGLANQCAIMSFPDGAADGILPSVEPVYRGILRHWRGKDDTTSSFSDLDGLPGLMILVDKGRMGDTFPKAMFSFDLRAAYYKDIIRSTFIQDAGRTFRYSAHPCCFLLLHPVACHVLRRNTFHRQDLQLKLKAETTKLLKKGGRAATLLINVMPAAPELAPEDDASETIAPAKSEPDIDAFQLIFTYKDGHFVTNLAANNKIKNMIIFFATPQVGKTGAFLHMASLFYELFRGQMEKPQRAIAAASHGPTTAASTRFDRALGIGRVLPVSRSVVATALSSCGEAAKQVAVAALFHGQVLRVGVCVQHSSCHDVAALRKAVAKKLIATKLVELEPVKDGGSAGGAGSTKSRESGDSAAELELQEQLEKQVTLRLFHHAFVVPGGHTGSSDAAGAAAASSPGPAAAGSVSEFSVAARALLRGQAGSLVAEAHLNDATLRRLVTEAPFRVAALLHVTLKMHTANDVHAEDTTSH